MRLRIGNLIRFYDHKEGDNSRHANALTTFLGEEMAIGVFCHFMQSRGQRVVVHDDPVGSGKPKGPRLDKWLQVGTQLYQSEVKNWSAHSLGGRELRIDASPSEVHRYKRDRWGEEFREGRLLKQETRKVLKRMRQPYRLQGLSTRPLLIYWLALHKTGADEPFFSVRVRNNIFSRLWVFSVSSYLRRLHLKLTKTIDLNMPVAKHRLCLLRTVIANERAVGRAA